MSGVEFEYLLNLLNAHLGPGGGSEISPSPFHARLTRRVLARISHGFIETEDEQYTHLEASEQLANGIYALLMLQPQCFPIRENIEGDLAHGFPHQRNVEKIMKHINRQDRALRHSPYYLYFAPCSFMSVRLHDFAQVAVHQKEDHEKAAALFALGFLSKVQTPIPQDHWKKLVWGTAFVCYHHSYPEKMPSSQQLQDGKLLDPLSLLLEVKQMAEKKGKDIYSFFPQFELIRDFLEGLETDTGREAAGRQVVSPVYTSAELEGLRKQALVFAAADKLDSIYPLDYSTNRTLIVGEKESFWVSYPDSFGRIYDEFSARRENAIAKKARCDFDRLLYECTRTEAFMGVSPEIDSLFGHGLRGKLLHLRKAIPDFLRGNSTPFTQVYEHRRDEFKRELVSPSAAGILRLVLKNIGEEEQLVLERLLMKYNLLMQAGFDNQQLTELERHILKLLDEALKFQNKHIYRYPGPLRSIVTLIQPRVPRPDEEGIPYWNLVTSEELTGHGILFSS